MLRENDLHLPTKGRGRIDLAASASRGSWLARARSRLMRNYLVC
jgi:hypothetical protein